MLEQLEIRDLRVIESASLQCSAGAHLIVGANGAGKTTILEAISLLGSGRSFRARSAGALVRFGAPAASVAGRRVLGEARQQRRIEVGRGRRDLVIDGTAFTRLEAARSMPLVVLSGEGVAGLTASPEHRRRQLFGLMFHVEPRFLTLWRNYRQALQQRNRALAARDRSFTAWDEPLAQAGDAILALAEPVLMELQSRMATPAAALGLREVHLGLEPGYSGSLRPALRAAAGSDQQRGFTSMGPHRLDVRISLGGVALGPHGSGGQIKRVAGALTAAQAALIRERGAAPLGLVDDLPAALDARGLRSLVELLFNVPIQWFATTPDCDRSQAAGARVFHVEHGRVSG